MIGEGRFITLEGGEGTGKSTLLAALPNRLVDQGYDVVVTREPGGTPLAERLRDLVLLPGADEAWPPLAEALLMNAARADHIEKLINPALAAGRWVISDRFADSTRVYQGVSGVDEATLQTLHSLVAARRQPDLTIILDGPVDQLMARRSARGTTDSFEARPLAFHQAVRERFLAIAAEEPDRCVVIDAMASPAVVLDAVLSEIAERLKS